MAFFDKDQDSKKAVTNDAVKTDAVKTDAVVGADVKAVSTDPVEIAKEKKREASRKMIARKKAATKILVDLALRVGTEEEKVAANYMSGEGRVAGVRTPSVDLMPKIFPAGVKTADEGDVFIATKLGRNEMKAFIKKQFKAGVFINFNAEKGIYTLVSEAEYTGPRPVAKKI